MLNAVIAFSQQLVFHYDSLHFPEEVTKAMSKIDKESARKVSSDFQSIWNDRIDVPRKQQILSVAKQMKDKRLSLQPHFEYFFSYITYALGETNIANEELGIVLELTEKSLHSYNKKQFEEFLLGINVFFARKYLNFTPQVKIQVENGSYQFIQADPQPEPIIEDTIVESDISNTEYPESIDDWDSWDNSENTDWGNESVDENIPSEDIPSVSIGSDFADMAKYSITFPELKGPAIQFENINLKMVTPNDSITIQGTSGTFLIIDKKFVGTGGTVIFPSKVTTLQPAHIEMGDFVLETNTTLLKAKDSKLFSPEWITEPIEGLFSFKSENTQKWGVRYPIFQSYHHTNNLKLDDDLRYQGGIMLQGNTLFGQSLDRVPGTLFIKKNGSDLITLQSKKFEFNPEKVSAEAARMLINMRADSLFHAGIQFVFDRKKKNFSAFSGTKDYKNTPFYSSLINGYIRTDELRWIGLGDSIILKTGFASSLKPTVIESADYFNETSFGKHTSILGFNPLKLMAAYSLKIRSDQFSIGEWATFGQITYEKALEACYYLRQNGFIEFDADMGTIHVLPYAIEQYKANRGKKDFDNLLIPSITDSSYNVILNIPNEELIVNGVEKFYITPAGDVRVVPDSSTLILRKDREMVFDGAIRAGDFVYKGKDFRFSYQDFKIDMPKIDSIRIQFKIIDSTQHQADITLHNHLTETSGTLYINEPTNKSGKEKKISFPYFVSNSSSIVYFDSPEILDGAYNRSVRFVVPPFEMDSVNRNDPSTIKFPGVFESNGIFPAFEDTLIIMPDNSLGFVHHIDTDRGYPLYNGEGHIYNKILLDYGGLTSDGKLDYLTTSLWSGKFTFYMDSVVSTCFEGIIKPGKLHQASFPQATMGNLRMKWLPLKDSMYLDNIGEPFSFYDSTANLDGEANVTSTGVYGSGVMFTRGSKTESNEYSFKERNFSAHHADFKILSENPEIPAVEGKDVSLFFDLEQNIADIHPERIGDAAIDFPFTQFKTSITDAVWHLVDNNVIMEKPEAVELEDSYFYSTKPELDSLAFSGNHAQYDLASHKLSISGIPYIISADAWIIPENNQTTIAEGSMLEPFQNAQVLIDTLHRYHEFINGNITIESRNKFSGIATYRLISYTQDTFLIKFGEFNLQPVKHKHQLHSRIMTVAEGDVTEDEGILYSPGFLYRGHVTMYADREALDLNGSVKLTLNSISDNHWIKYDHLADHREIAFDLRSSENVFGDPLDVGIHISPDSGMYVTLTNTKLKFEDKDVFMPKGILRYDTLLDSYVVEEIKTETMYYPGTTFMYNDSTTNVIYEGEIRLMDDAHGFKNHVAAMGFGNAASSSYEMSVSMTLDFHMHPTTSELMVANLMDVIENLGAEQAHATEADIMQRMAILAGQENIKNYEQSFLNEYAPIAKFSGALQKSIAISNAKMRWSQQEKSWFSEGKIGISNSREWDINAMFDGFLEIREDHIDSDDFTLFFQASPAVWYYFHFNGDEMVTYSSDSKYMDDVSSEKTGKSATGTIRLTLAEEGEVMEFIKRYRKSYYNLTDPYELEFPSDVNFDDTNYDTIETIDDEDTFDN